MSRPSEFDLIRDCFAHGYPRADELITGIGDDCSVIRPPQGYELAQSIDTQVADVHFPASAPPDLIATRALRCAVSDLAAMGARPQGFHLALTLPDNSPDWLTAFAAGLRSTAILLNIPLLGGDTTRGPVLIVTIAVQGWLPQGQQLGRDKACRGDDVWLSGPVGGAALALPTVLANPATDTIVTAPYYRPAIALRFSQQLLTCAHAALDISDGLLQDAGHIALASGVDIELTDTDIPTAVPREHPQWSECLSGGDDYQLLFTAPPDAAATISALAHEHRLDACRRIGIVTEGSGAIRVKQGNDILTFQKNGYEHF